MNTPALRPVHPEAGLRVQAGVAATERVFEVVRPGVFEGRWYRLGDVVVCGGAAEGAACVLVPGGVGHAVLGHVREGVLYGSVGEKCAPVRWAPSGALRGHWRPSPGGWSRVVDAEVACPAPAAQVRLPRGLRAQGQLALFGGLVAA